MAHRITVLKSAVTRPEGKTYPVCELGYKTEDGKTKGMKIFGIGDLKPIYEVAANANTGDVLEATFAQNDKGFWQFSSLAPTGEKSVPADKPAPASNSRGNWETSEERAARQVMIVRQSSLSNAIAFAAANNPKGASLDVDGVIGLARAFEAYVMEK